MSLTPQTMGNPSNTDTVPLPQNRAQLFHALFGTYSNNGIYDAGDFAQTYRNGYEDLQDASGLDTSPKTGLASGPCY